VKLSQWFCLPLVVVLWCAGSAAAADPWIISSEVGINEPTELGDVIIVSGGSLTVHDVPDPGVQIAGTIWVVGDGQLRLENSAIRFLSTYHGQYALAGVDQSRIEVTGCDYRIPAGVQHALLVAGEAQLTVEDADFDPVQLISAETSTITARRLNGNFEVIVQDDSHMRLEDIPRDPGSGDLWVWVEFPSGSQAAYSPPLPGFIDHWSFPPASAEGIRQTVLMDRCQAKLWPMLVRGGSYLTLHDIAEGNWIVVGLYLPTSATVAGLRNGELYEDTTVDLGDRELHLVNASIDTWNLYPQADAVVEVQNSLLGEILSFQSSRVRMVNTTIDGSGGFFGARESSIMRAFDCEFTATIEATQDATIELHTSSVRPYPQDTTGEWTRFGAYDNARLLADHTSVETTPALGGDGLIAVTAISDAPATPPADNPAVLHGWAAILTLGAPVLQSWRVDAIPGTGGLPVVVGEGEHNVDDNTELGVWLASNPNANHLLRIILSDSLGRTLTGYHHVPGTAGPDHRSVRGRRRP
jgi:hypothetical protein